MSNTRVSGRKTTRNLLLDGFEEVADFVARTIKRDRAGYAVHVSDSGAVRMTRVDKSRKVELPADWLAGVYPYTDCRVEYIEADLLERERELRAAQAVAA